MSGKSIKERIMEIASHRPSLKLPYNLVADVLGIPRSSLSRAIKDLKKQGKVPQSFMPPIRRGIPVNNPNLELVQTINKEMLNLQRNGTTSISISLARRLVHEISQEVLSKA